jgi:hypothetical protein
VLFAFAKATDQDYLVRLIEQHVAALGWSSTMVDASAVTTPRPDDANQAPTIDQFPQSSDHVNLPLRLATPEQTSVATGTHIDSD